LHVRRALADHAVAVPIHRSATALLIAAIVISLASCARPRTLQTVTGLAQGTTYTLQWWSEDRVDTRALAAAVTAELERLDALLSNYRSDSVLERFNATRSAKRCRASWSLCSSSRRTSIGVATAASTRVSGLWCGSGVSTATTRMFRPPTRSRPRLRV
jgi:hypothetical protein